VHFLCVGTPQRSCHPGADLSQLYACVDTLAPLLRRPCLVAGKSTTPVGSQELTVLRLAETIRELVGSASPVEFIPRPVDDPAVRRPDTSLAQRHLGWRPATTLETGLRRTIGWFTGTPAPGR
jgi:nucleoside-diphosphate-sugar epimerase